MFLKNEKKIAFHFLIENFYFPNRFKLKKFILFLLTNEKRNVITINYIFCTDEYLLELNKFHLDQNAFTDILTFDLSEIDKNIIADIYISIERIRKNALSFRTTFKNELHRVIFHGALHLCGYTDKTVKQAQHMRKQEDFYLFLYFT